MVRVPIDPPVTVRSELANVPASRADAKVIVTVAVASVAKAPVASVETVAAGWSTSIRSFAPTSVVLVSEVTSLMAAARAVTCASLPTVIITSPCPERLVTELKLLNCSAVPLNPEFTISAVPVGKSILRTSAVPFITSICETLEILEVAFSVR